ncbi:hypothetical protein [Methylobacterium nonmethylotrophicum]|uniref:Uncharacterized protein n=1 Tax=Methylobacterium nonmethylotrophicum TaxID=1141884 RepID=A0A4Z0NFF7_9HYPH|nr:hypothetical protein [Methylobacterium nonmethylotrophicum]TGD93730.1 hypothetical protein EU555_33125 [Methylobacterium nonmethylotrophicum]
MSRPALTQPQFHGTDLAVLEDVAATMATAQNYANAAASLAAANDVAGLAHAVRQAANCVLAAADLLQELRPVERPRSGERRR